MSKRNGCNKHPDRMTDCCVDCLKLELYDYVDTVKAMLFAARGDECDLVTLEREMNAVSTKPSEYIRHIVSGKDRQLSDARAEIERLKCCTNCGSRLWAATGEGNCKNCKDFNRWTSQSIAALAAERGG